MNKIYIVLGLIITLLTSCDDDDKGFADFDAGGTATKTLAGEWFVQEYTLSGEVFPGYFKVLTFNTAANKSNEIWLQDSDAFAFQSKLKADISNLTFNANAVPNASEMPDLSDGAPPAERITITDGKILLNEGFASVTRTVVDSISFVFESSTQTTGPIIIAGHRRTGFQEDEH